jgi:hypothetical protein
MPGWATIKDPDGNRYFVDENFKLHMPGDEEPRNTPAQKHEFEYYLTEDIESAQKPLTGIEARGKPVSIDGLEYYLAQGEELIKQHRPAQGLYFLKGVRLLSDTDPRASSAGMKASKMINEYIRKEKERYPIVDHQSALVLIREGKKITADNGWCGYRISAEAELSVMKRQLIERHNYANDSALLGVRTTAPAGRFDALISISAEIFHYVIRSHDRLEDLWSNKNADAFTRETIRENEKEIHYSFKGGAPDEYAGFERVIVRGNRGVRIRIFVPAERLGSSRDMIRTVIESFELRGD